MLHILQYHRIVILVRRYTRILLGDKSNVMRTFTVQLEEDLQQYEACASRGEDNDFEDTPFFFVATDTAETQEVVKKVCQTYAILFHAHLPDARLLALGHDGLYRTTSRYKY